MKFFILVLFSSLAQAQYYSPSSCPYMIKDQASLDILKNTQPILSEEMRRIRNEIQSEQNNCLLPSIDEVARSEQLIKALANKMVPPPQTFESLMLAGQQLNCTTTVSGFNEVMKSYKSFVLENFRSLPDNERDLARYLDMTGADGEKVNGVFYTCHRNQVGNSKNLAEFESCIDRSLFGQVPNSPDAMTFQIWQTNCGQDLGERSREIQQLLNESTQERLKQKTAEQLISASYEQINNTIDSLLKIDPSCRAAPQVANIANSLVSAGVGLGQMMGSPWTGLSLNLMAKPISQMINRIAQGEKRKQESDLKELYEEINNSDKQRNEKFLCSMLSMQKLKCETIQQYKGKSAIENCIPGAPLKDNFNVRNIIDVLNNIKSRNGKSDPLNTAYISEENALDYMQDQNIEQLSELHNQFFRPIKGVNFLGADDQDLSLYEYIYGKNGQPGVLSQIDVNGIESKSDIIKYKKEKMLADELKSSLDEFNQSMNLLLNGELNPQAASLALNSYKKVSSLLVDGISGIGSTNNPSMGMGMGYTSSPYQNKTHSQSQSQSGSGGGNYYQQQQQPQSISQSQQYQANENYQQPTQNYQQNGNYQQSTQNYQQNGNYQQPTQNYQQNGNYVQSGSGANPSGPFNGTGTARPASGNINLPFLLTLYYDQMGKHPKNSDTYNYALMEMKAHAQATIDQTKDTAIKGLAVSDRFDNTENYFNFMSSSYTQDQILSPMLDKIQIPSSAPSSKAERELYFDAKVLPALRDCLFLYQPLSKGTTGDKSSRKMLDDYKNKCSFAFNCQKELGINIDLNSKEDLNSTTSFERYRPICHIQNNFGFIFSKAKINFVNSGNACGKL